MRERQVIALAMFEDVDDAQIIKLDTCIFIRW